MSWITTEDGTVLITEDGVIITTEPTPPQPLQTIIPSYLYQEYSDDADLQAFVASFNSLGQSYLDWFNQTPLAVYTNPTISGPLLDWIPQGIYGLSRPVFASTITRYIAGVNAFPLDTVSLNGHHFFQSGTATTATDDFYKRVLTWHTYIGDGRYFNVTVLRKKVARFLYGINGVDVGPNQAQNVHIAAGFLPPPAAPGLTQGPGGTFPARNYGARVSYVTPIGEGLAGAANNLNVSANGLLIVWTPVTEDGAQFYNVYVGILAAVPAHFRAGLNSAPINGMALNGTNMPPQIALTKQNASPISIGTNWNEPSSGLIAGTPLPTTDNSNTPTNFIITVPSTAGAAASIFAQAMGQGILAFPFQLTASVIVK